ncbi:alkene reductase [Hymenobacter actinosclerus]|uniref:N-ethylmaleimide reductase n=1 Tax=Hymenobacter actinosclerus TaxID=82805 RepID=A0A1I0HIS0_9BACT|nr:alkene reductase [Hymenobacter actinosclerus]SET82934.1 N-ethylmaleimide reductase [Hymenobacter actinosclerus]
MSDLLFSPAQLGSLTLRNKVVMAPMTRSRALGNVPGPLIAEYYAQRASAGLIITEGTAPAASGLGYARIPGLFNAEQVAGWKLVTDAVHAREGRIFVQFMHTGRISHDLNLPEGEETVAPSAVAAAGQMWTDQQQMQPHPTPRALTTAEVKQLVQDFAKAAKLAIEAGFDGVELHAANGYLLEQFLNPHTNQRTDEYGGSAENRARFVLEVADATVAAIGAGRTGIRISPWGTFNDMGTYEGVSDFYEYLATELQRRNLVYLHLINPETTGAPAASADTVPRIRRAFTNTLILSADYDAAKAEAELQSGRADLVAFGRPFISNPDLVERMQAGAGLAKGDPATFYAPAPEGFHVGYTDYPALAESQLA